MEKDFKLSQVKRSESTIRLAEKPKQIETIEKDVKSGVPRGKATMGHEDEAGYGKEPAKPSVPRGNAEMGQEGKAEWNKKMDLPDVAKDHSFMGHEQEAQKGMPEINNEIKGTIIAKKLKEVDSVEGNVDVPRGKATIGNEGKENIDVATAKPEVPRGNAEMGEEGKAEWNKKNEAPEVPMGDAYMGGEKDAQKGMPANNDEMLKQVQQVSAQKRQVQMERIAMARREAARDTAAWLAANNRIASDKSTFDSVVTALSAFEIDKIQPVAEQMFPEVTKKVASKQATGHAIPAIIMASKSPEVAGESLTERLGKAFTVGSTKLNDNIEK